ERRWPPTPRPTRPPPAVKLSPEPTACDGSTSIVDCTSAIRRNRLPSARFARREERRAAHPCRPTEEPPMDTFLNYIGGEWVPSVTGERFESRNPAHPSQVLGEFQSSSAADVDVAVQAARRAQKAWRRTPAPKRAEIVERAASMLEAQKDELARLVTREMGKTLVDSGYDVQGAITSGKYMAGEGFRMFGETVPSGLPN